MKISNIKYHQLNASIRTIRIFCNERKCDNCPFFSRDGCKLRNDCPHQWEDLPKEVLDKE